MDEQTIDLIAERVIAALRDDLEMIVTELSLQPKANRQLTVDQVAQRLGVSSSTVYAHWREWGGYKLGSGEKAPIRFDGIALPIAAPPNHRRLRRKQRSRRRDAGARSSAVTCSPTPHGSPGRWTGLSSRAATDQRTDHSQLA